MAAGILDAAAEQKFQKLTGAQIQSRFAGMEMSDGVHWSDVYRHDGTLVIYDLAQKSNGKWRVEKGELCIERSSDDANCYQVWMSGSKVELRREGSRLPLEGELRRPKDRQ